MFNLRVIGHVASGVADRKALGPLGVRAAIELLPEYASGLLKFERHSHVWVLAWLDRAERDVLQVTPRGVADPSPAGLHGVFAVRSPVRPNPIGLTLAHVLGVKGTRIELDRLDLLDGTPVIDLKPYFVNRDIVFSAANVQIGKPLSREALHDSLMLQAVNFHGEQCPDVELAVTLYEQFRADVLEMEDPVGILVTAPLVRPHLIDGLMGMTRATPGRGNLCYGSENKVCFEAFRKSATYDLPPAR
ncbi:MAG TPA: tRNA (N6-threonylcarbamoyladenosine(37)-N6)-methyltransferase TrmO [Bryobacteraceae bacterium]|nr:tRNA (N6-threonylcarbamoyladenosine(37)-N6)-methyltransferase TrmO [Bryobacteraceae bacterium]